MDHTTVFRWIHACAPELRKRIRPHLRRSDGPWRADETYVRVKGRWMYLYHAVDGRGATIGFLLSATRDAAAAKRFIRRAHGRPHTADPLTVTVDKNPAYPCAVAGMKQSGELWRSSRLRRAKLLNNIVEQDHRRVKRLVRPRLGVADGPPSSPAPAASSPRKTPAIDVGFRSNSAVRPRNGEGLLLLG